MKPAQKVAIREELKKLQKQHDLTPNRLVEDARKKTHPAHDLFEWDNAVAGNAWRLQQARTIITEFEITVTVNKTEHTINEFVRDPRKKDNEQGYISVEEMKTDKSLAAEFIQREVGMASTYVEKARSYALVLGLESRIDYVIGDLDSLKHEALLAATR